MARGWCWRLEGAETLRTARQVNTYIRTVSTYVLTYIYDVPGTSSCTARKVFVSANVCSYVRMNERTSYILSVGTYIRVCCAKFIFDKRSECDRIR